jgi:GNAT superfamily N-acetyltransferase
MTSEALHIILRPEALDAPVVRELIDELNDELDAMYPEPGANHFELPTADEFLVAWQPSTDATEHPVGCGALRVIEPGVGELKRMYVRPEARGRRVAGMILTALETAALGLGCHRLVLETGTRQNAAMSLYLRHGYTPIPCWGEYLQSADTSTCLGKTLRPSGAVA